MFTKTLSTIGERLAEIIGLVRDVDRRLDKLEVIALVREPAAATAADAYDGLRKQVIASATARWTHLAQLAQLDKALAQGADREIIGKLVEDWLAQTALDRVRDAGHPEADLLFELVEDHGGALEVLEPAYVDRLTGRLVRPGRARRAELPAEVTGAGVSTEAPGDREPESADQSVPAGGGASRATESSPSSGETADATASGEAADPTTAAATAGSAGAQSRGEGERA